MYEFFFCQKQSLGEEKTYDRILNKAANYSRKYLNSIFARKVKYEFVNPFAGKLLQNYKYFEDFKTDFQRLNDLIENDSL